MSAPRGRPLIVQPEENDVPGYVATKEAFADANGAWS